MDLIIFPESNALLYGESWVWESKMKDALSVLNQKNPQFSIRRYETSNDHLEWIICWIATEKGSEINEWVRSCDVMALTVSCDFTTVTWSSQSHFVYLRRVTHVLPPSPATTIDTNWKRKYLFICILIFLYTEFWQLKKTLGFFFKLIYRFSKSKTKLLLLSPPSFLVRLIHLSSSIQTNSKEEEKKLTISISCGKYYFWGGGLVWYCW